MVSTETASTVNVSAITSVGLVITVMSKTNVAIPIVETMADVTLTTVCASVMIATLDLYVKFMTNAVMSNVTQVLATMDPVNVKNVTRVIIVKFMTTAVILIATIEVPVSEVFAYVVTAI